MGDHEGLDPEEDVLELLPAEIKPIILKLPVDERSGAAKSLLTFMSLTIESYWDAPLPPPHLLRAYDEILPGGAQRIFLLMESQTKHRQNLETIVIPKEIKQSARGQWFGFIISLFGLGAAVYLGVNGAQTVASVIAGTTILGLVYAFVLGKRSNRRDISQSSQNKSEEQITPHSK